MHRHLGDISHPPGGFSTRKGGHYVTPRPSFLLSPTTLAAVSLYSKSNPQILLSRRLDHSLYKTSIQAALATTHYPSQPRKELEVVKPNSRNANMYHNLRGFHVSLS